MKVKETISKTTKEDVNLLKSGLFEFNNKKYDNSILYELTQKYSSEQIYELSQRIAKVEM